VIRSTTQQGHYVGAVCMLTAAEKGVASIARAAAGGSQGAGAQGTDNRNLAASGGIDSLFFEACLGARTYSECTPSPWIGV